MAPKLVAPWQLVAFKEQKIFALLSAGYLFNGPGTCAEGPERPFDGIIGRLFNAECSLFLAFDRDTLMVIQKSFTT